MAQIPSPCKLYVGNLGSQGTEADLRNAFAPYGPLSQIWLARDPPGFAFVTFQNEQDARDAVNGLSGKTIAGRQVCIELTCRDNAQPPISSYDLLPTELLELFILRRSISLRKRIQLRQVASRWKEIIEKNLKPMTSLAIHCHEDFHHKETDLAVNPQMFMFDNNEEAKAFFGLLAKLFPNLSKITINMFEGHNFDGPRVLNTFPSHILRNLTQLSELTEVRLLDIRFSANQLKPPHAEEPRLNSVKRLHLSLSNIRGSNDAACKLWIALTGWFPKVERLTVECYEEWTYFLKRNKIQNVPDDVIVHIRLHDI